MNDQHMPTLKWLANVVQEIVKPKGLQLETPDSAVIGNIMNHVIKS
jgi:hypothetical protein